ncbi:hypothetical protein Q8A73_018264 [Channa argus]|nr:hypothetical protein Q8A73_018264 [Channa argus]
MSVDMLPPQQALEVLLPQVPHSSSFSSTQHEADTSSFCSLLPALTSKTYSINRPPVAALHSALPDPPIATRMKLTVAFLVLSMVVIMAEPGECFFGTILKGAFHGTLLLKLLHLLAHGQKEDQQEQLDTRSIDYNAGRPGYD